MTLDHDEAITGLRQLADWLTLNPTAPIPAGIRLLVPLGTPAAVAEHAERFDLDVQTDAHGVTSAEIAFGDIVYHAYGYADFAAHIEAMNAAQAQEWADQHDLRIVKKAAAEARAHAKAPKRATNGKWTARWLLDGKPRQRGGFTTSREADAFARGYVLEALAASQPTDPQDEH